jgi:hypothetical protein
LSGAALFKCVGTPLTFVLFGVSWRYERTEKTGMCLNLLKPTGHVMHQPFNIQQLYALPTLYLCVLYLPENKQRLVLLTA